MIFNHQLLYAYFSLKGAGNNRPAPCRPILTDQIAMKYE